VSVDVKKICGEKEQNWGGDEPLDPGETDVDRGSRGEIDAKGHETEGHGRLGNVAPDLGNDHEMTGELRRADEKRIEVVENTENEPGVQASRAGEDDVDSYKQTKKSDEEERGLNDPDNG